MSLYSRLVTRYAGTRWFAWTASRVAPRLDRLVHRATRGRRLATPLAIPTLLLTTTGRRSGRKRVSPLSFIVAHGHPHIVGTNFGRDAHPAWSANLLANPTAEVEFESERWTARAVPIAEPDQHALWLHFEEMLPAYSAYRTRLKRSVRMFRLERV